MSTGPDSRLEWTQAFANRHFVRSATLWIASLHDEATFEHAERMIEKGR